MAVSIQRIFISVLLIFVINGCNLFDPIHDAGRENDLPLLIENARYALIQDNPDEAIDLLEKALTIDPDHIETRILLGTAILRQAGISIMLLKEIADFVTEIPADNVPVTQSFCTFNPDASNLPPIYLEDLPAYLRLEEAQNPLRRVLVYLDPNVISLEPESVPDPDLLAQGLITRSTVLLGLSLVDIKKMTAVTEATWFYRDQMSVGFCTDTAESLVTMTTFLACEQADQLNQATLDLELRLSVLKSAGNSFTDGITDAFREMRQAILSTLQSSCVM